MSNLRDLVSNPIDTAKEFITAQYFTETPCDAALLDFSSQFKVTISGEYATITHGLTDIIVTVRVTYDFHR